MASCKECLHYDLCASITGLIQRVIIAGDKANERCQLFKPTADVAEVKHGEWLPTNIPSYFGGIIHECSECGAKDGEHSSVLGSYCWRCGAKMDGERRKANAEL